MEEWLLGDPDSDPDESDDPNLSIDEIVAAFREALLREQGQIEDPGRPTRSEPEPEPDSASSEAEPGTSQQSPDQPPRSSKVEKTIAAFRRARRRKEGETSDESEREQASTPPSVEREREDEARDESSTPEESRDSDLGVGGAIEDFAPAFRDALKRQSGSEEDDSEEPDERDEGAREPTTPPEQEAQQTGRAGDGVPPSSEVEVSGGARSWRGRVSSYEQASQRDTTFLWVTGRPEDDSTSVSIDNLSDTRALEADAFLLEGGGTQPYEFLTRIRGHSEMSVYLKPVFWMHSADEDSRVADHVDGEWKREERSALDSLQQRALSINNRINNVVGGGARDDSGMELRVLRFIATRNHKFAPKRTAENPDGFVYPQLTPLLDRQSSSGGGELVQVLSILEERRLLKGEFVMRQHACRNCGSGFLNFEEMCPHCGATDLDADDLVHHFRCAFTGPLKEYKKEQGKLVCPKCDRGLKQIGVDYDKPSVVHTCRRCHEQFQDPEVQTTCYQCERTNPPEQQVDRQIKEYEITALGEETAVYGLSDSLLSILERESRVLDYATFQLIVESEAARIERYQRSASSLLMVRVAGLKQLRAELGQRSQEVVEEIATAFDNTLRSSDYLSARDESLYLFLLTETDEQGARRAGERLEQNIEGVLGQNLEHPPELKTGVQPLHPDLDLDSIAEQFLASQAQGRGAVTAA